MLLVYLDNCALQRPLDDRVQFRIRVEADAITAVLESVEAGRVELASSPALRAEVSRGRDRSRQEFAVRALALASQDAPTSAETEAIADEFGRAGLRTLDALHLAFAVALRADFFCTTDDRLLRRARTANTRGVRVVDPLELLSALTR